VSGGLGGGNVSFGWFSLLGWHIAVGFVLTVVVFFHMFARARRLRKRDIVGRRRMVRFGAVLLGGVVFCMKHPRFKEERA
jgi:threonine/homoserine/homoserine lactone efflux protein